MSGDFIAKWRAFRWVSPTFYRTTWYKFKIDILGLYKALEYSNKNLMFLNW